MSIDVDLIDWDDDPLRASAPDEWTVEDVRDDLDARGAFDEEEGE